jgi:CrcB protein
VGPIDSGAMAVGLADNRSEAANSPYLVQSTCEGGYAMFSAGAGPGRRGEAAAGLPDRVDPDVDLHVPGERHEWSSHRWVLPVIALGGILGACARHGLELLWNASSGQWPWATLVTNASGCVLIGMLMVQVIEVGRAHPLLRPFLGVGLLGGYTTFSTYAVQTRALWTHSQRDLSLLYLVLTPALALVSVVAGVVIARALHRSREVLAQRKAAS